MDSVATLAHWIRMPDCLLHAELCRPKACAMRRLLTVEDVAAICQVSRRTVFEWVRSAGLPRAPLPGRVLRFHQEDVESFLGGQKVGHPTDSSAAPGTNVHL